MVHDVRTAAQSIDGGLIFAGLTLVSLLFSWTSQSFLACSVCTYSIFLLFLLFSTSAYIIACSRYIRPSFDPYIFALNTLSPGGIPSGTIHLSLLKPIAMYILSLRSFLLLFGLIVVLSNALSIPKIKYGAVSIIFRYHRSDFTTVVDTEHLKSANNLKMLPTML